jgi:glutaredoxin
VVDKMNESVIVYSKFVGPEDTLCPFCDKAKALLTEQEIPFTELALTPPEREILYDRLELVGVRRTVPQVVILDCTGEEQVIGGHNALVHSQIESLFHDPKARERANEQQLNTTY